METPDFIDERLVQMRAEVRKVSRQRRRWLEKASFMKPTLKEDKDLHLKFLRASRYDVTKAASNLCLFFECKQELFGDQKLASPISLGDLDEDDLACLNTSAMRILPNHDRSGRLVFVSEMRKMQFRHWKNQV